MSPITFGPQASGENSMLDAATAEKVRRAQLSGAESVTRDATLGELDGSGKLTDG